MNPHNNEAGRLHDLLQRAFAISNGEQAWVVWSRLLNIPLPDGDKKRTETLPVVCKRLLLINELLHSIETDIREQETEHESKLLLRYFPDLQLVCFPAHLAGPWGECRKHLSQSALDQLEMCALRLPKETEIPKEELDEITKQVDELIVAVRDSQLNKTLKRWLLEQLFILRRGIEEFWLNGGRGLKAALARVVGEVVIHKKAIAELKDEKTGDPAIFKRFETLVAVSFKVASKINTAYSLLEHVHTLLPMLSDLAT